jgi:membrane protein YdbS with pleckstrin-like domain
MFKLSFLLLIFTIPFLNSNITYGLPLWVYLSLGVTIVYAGILIFIIEKKWKKLRDENE